MSPTSRENNKRHIDEIKATIKESLAGLGLEDTTIFIRDCSISNPDGVSDSNVNSKVKEEYEMYLTDPRRI